MENLTSIKEELVFGLDIGTRNIVGVVGYQDRNGFHIVAMASREHETRAMLDGQIHDIYKVGDTIRKVRTELEKQLDKPLKDVCIAAAGRVLKTVNETAEYVFEEETRVTSEHIYSLNLLAVEKAHKDLNENSPKDRFYCVGNTPIRYQLNGYDITNLEGHKADKISVELIATFLPEEVVDGLYEAVEYAGLNVASLTLEPIAAINIAIPENYRLLNIALIDVGAGTSDICITKDGGVVAYGMIPFAGDEISEVIAKTYLVDFNTAEKIKVDASLSENEMVTFNDIMGLEMTVPAEDIIKSVDEVVDNMAKNVADKIMELNGGRPVSAVFVVGGGGKIPGYTQKVAQYLGIVKERVAVRGPEVLAKVDFQIDNYEKDSLFVTPVGICTNYYNQKNNFIFVNVNDERIKMYDNENLTVVDAVMQVGFPNERLFPRRGKALQFSVNGKARLVRGEPGEGAVIKLNDKITNLNSHIEQNDIITVKESTIGEEAHMTIGQLDEYKGTILFHVNGKNISCPKFAYVNGELKSEFYDICDGDNIRMENFYTVKQLFEFLDFDTKLYDIYVNNEIADIHTKVYENFSVKAELKNENDNVTDLEDTYNVENMYDTEDSYSVDNIYDTDVQTNYKDTIKKEAKERTKEKIKWDIEQNITEVLDEENKVSDEILQQDFKPQSQLIHDIYIIINGSPVKLSGKKNYVLVDLFEVYNFDLTRTHGELIFNHNGKKASYMEPLYDGDVIELRWEENL